MAGQPITLTLPNIGDPFPTAAAQVTTALTALEVELERKVVPADMSMSADLSFLVAGTNYRVKDLLASSYVLNASALNATTYPRATYFTGADGDFYINDGAGRQVRVTAGGVVNTAASGNITSTGAPAYGTSSVELRWDGADLEYEMRAGSGANDFADVRLDDVILNDGSGNFLRVTAPAMAADYTLTLPNATPASTSVVQMSSAGALTASASGNIATTGTVATGALTVTGAATVSTTLGVTGTATVGNLTTAGTVTGAVYDGGSTTDGDLDVLSLDVGAPGIISAGGLLCGANSTVTVSGTGRYIHGDFVRIIPASAFVMTDPAPPTSVLNVNTFYDYQLLADGTLATEPNLVAPLILDVGKRIRNLQFVYFGGGDAGDRTARLVRTELATDTVVNIVSSTVTTASGVVTIEFNAATLLATGQSVITDGFQYNLVFTGQGDAVTGDFFKACRVVYDAT